MDTQENKKLADGTKIGRMGQFAHTRMARALALVSTMGELRAKVAELRTWKLSFTFKLGIVLATYGAGQQIEVRMSYYGLKGPTTKIVLCFELL